MSIPFLDFGLRLQEVPFVSGTLKFGVNGSVRVCADDGLGSAGFGVPWGQKRGWTNAFNPNSFNGSGMMDSQLPYLLQVDGLTNNKVVAVTSATNARYFDLVNGVYVPHFYVQDKLVYDAVAGEFVLTDTKGDQIRFYDFTGSLLPQQGQFKSFTDPDGHATTGFTTTLRADGKPDHTQR